MGHWEWQASRHTPGTSGMLRSQPGWHSQMLGIFGMSKSQTGWYSQHSIAYSLLRSTTSGCGPSCTTFVSPISLPQAQMTAQVGVQYPSLYCCPYSLPPFLPSSLSPLIPYCTVKLWCANRPHSIFSMGTKANVCCVRFRPANQYHMAYGSAGNPPLTLVKKSNS